MRSREIRDWKRWGGPPAKIAACAVGVVVAVLLVVFGAVIASVVAVAVATFRGARAGAATAPARRADHLSPAGTTSRLRAAALQRAAADEAAR